MTELLLFAGKTIACAAVFAGMTFVIYRESNR